MSDHDVSLHDHVVRLDLTEYEIQEFHQIWRDLERHFQVSNNRETTLTLVLNALVAIDPTNLASAQLWFETLADMINRTNDRQEDVLTTIKSHPLSLSQLL